jgi:beta-glucosidase
MLRQLTICLAVVAGTASEDRPWASAGKPIAERVAALLKEMTLEEKINQTLNDYYDGAMSPGFLPGPEGQRAIASEGMRYLFTFCSNKNITACIKNRNHYATVAATQTRLGIPLSFSAETLHGARYGPQYPMPINLGSSWNESLVTEVFSQTAAMAAATGVNIGLSPVVNMFPDPRFGRLQEGFSEDPLLTSAMGVAAVLGLQGPVYDPKTYIPDQTRHVSAVVKHFLAYGHAEQGGIDGGPATLDEQTLRERYLPPWKALADRGMLRGVMASQSAVNHIPMHCHKRLITDVLRKELNASDIFVHSDGGCVISLIKGVYRMAATEGQAAALALGAGVDMDFAGCSYSQLAPEIKAGRVPVADLDRAVSNILRVKFATGLFDRPTNISTDVAAALDLDAFEKTARDAAHQSITLLLNNVNKVNNVDRFNNNNAQQQLSDKPVPSNPSAAGDSSAPTAAAGDSSAPTPALPLVFGGVNGIKSMLLAGPLIDDVQAQEGGYSHPEPAGRPTVTILAAAQVI